MKKQERPKLYLRALLIRIENVNSFLIKSCANYLSKVGGGLWIDNRHSITEKTAGCDGSHDRPFKKLYGYILAINLFYVRRKQKK